jgi:hypothetical protein
MDAKKKLHMDANHWRRVYAAKEWPLGRPGLFDCDPHPKLPPDSRLTFWGYVLWMLDHAGFKGRSWAAGFVEQFKAVILETEAEIAAEKEIGRGNNVIPFRLPPGLRA